MFQNVIISALLLVLSGVFSVVFGQTVDNAKPKMISGEVTAVSSSVINIKTPTGDVAANLTPSTDFKKAAADNPKTMTPSTVIDVAVGDKVIVSGFPSADGKSVPAIRVYLMAKSDIASKNAKNAEAWKTRGISGTVTAVNPSTSQITLETTGLMGKTTTVLTPKVTAIFHRYSTESDKFSNAKKSNFTEIQKGDQLRAKGDKSADGTSFSAEEILAGSFQTVVGTVKSIDAATSTIVITDQSGKKETTISLAGVSFMKRFPAELGERMAGMQAGGPRPGGAAPGANAPTGTTPPAGGQPGQGGGRPGGMGGGARGGLDEMIERAPSIQAADLKVGEMIAISSAKTAANEKVIAYRLVAGVEPFVRIALMQAAASGARGAASSPGMNIPGLDGGF